MVLWHHFTRLGDFFVKQPFVSVFKISQTIFNILDHWHKSTQLVTDLVISLLLQLRITQCSYELLLKLSELFNYILACIVDFLADLWFKFTCRFGLKSNLIQEAECVAYYLQVVETVDSDVVVGILRDIIEIETRPHNLHFRYDLTWEVFVFDNLSNLDNRPFIAKLFNKVVHRRILTELFHVHANVRITHRKLNLFFAQLPKH